MNNKNTTNWGCLLIALALIIFNLVAGAWSVNEVLSWFSKDIYWVWDTIVGLFVAEITFPIAIIGKILMFFGIL